MELSITFIWTVKFCSLEMLSEGRIAASSLMHYLCGPKEKRAQFDTGNVHFYLPPKVKRFWVPLSTRTGILPRRQKACSS